MATAEQPLKKRKLFDPAADPAAGAQSALVPPRPPSSLSSSPLSQDEILRRRRNRDEIRSLYDCYRRIRFCVDRKDAHLMPEFEQAYLSLITASRGCTSVQRIVAELIPRYASFCPTALEAAAKVSINMYNWSLAIIMGGDDVDGVAYLTAKACIFGLVDICQTASYEAPSSSVIQGICSAVFLNVLTFLTSTFEGKDIYQLGSMEIRSLQEPMESFYNLKQEQADDNEPPLSKLFKYRALCLLRIFFTFPKNLLAACFELFLSNGSEAAYQKGALYFLNQLVCPLDADKATHALNNTDDGVPLSTDSAKDGTDSRRLSQGEPSLNENNAPKRLSLVAENCFMGMAIKREWSLRSWLLTKYKELCESLTSQDTSTIASLLEKVFGPLSQLTNEAESEENGTSRRDHSLGMDDASISDTHYDNNAAGKDAGQIINSRHTVLSGEIDVQSINNRAREKSVSTHNLDAGDQEGSCLDGITTPRQLTSNHFFLASTSKDQDIEKDGSYVESHVKVDKIQGSKIDLGLSARIVSPGGAHNILPSPRHCPTAPHHAIYNQSLWYPDGDAAALDVFSASKQLWLGSLGHDASETVVRMQFEDFGPLEHFLFVPTKDFALIEYRNIMDAVKAREYMQGSSPWGGCLHIKFLDRGLGSRGTVKGVAVGESCHVYIGKVSTQWAKDEILHELMMVGLRNPRMVIDLTSESALLLEFWTAEEATNAMVCIRHQRRKSLMLNVCSKDKYVSNSQLLVRQVDASVSDEELINAFSRFGELSRWQFNRPESSCLIDFQSYQAADLAKSHLHGARFGAMSIHVEFRVNSPGSGANNMLQLPSTPTLHDSATMIRSSRLYSFFASLCAKYKINDNASSYSSHTSKQYHSSVMRNEDRVTTNFLWIGFPDIPSPIFTEDELMALCRLAVENSGSVIRLTRATMQSSCWYVEFSSVDAAATALKNIRSCPGMFLQIEFRNSGVPSYHDERLRTSGRMTEPGYFPSHGDLYASSVESKLGNHYPTSLTNKIDGSAPDLVSPKAKVEFGSQVHRGHAFQSNWTTTSSAEMIGSRKVDNVGTGVSLERSFADSSATTHAVEHVWQYKKQEVEPPIIAQGILPRPPIAIRNGSVIPPPIPTPSFVRPLYGNPSSSWDTSLNPTGVFPMDNRAAVPFIPSSITPLSELHGVPMQHFDAMVTAPSMPNSVPPPPPPEATPPLPCSPPPLPPSQPPSVPPPPSSPPPVLEPTREPSNLQSGEPSTFYQWQGTLSKSGVHYCTIYATREDSAVCKYLTAISEPADWPTRLDITKRTDIRHVKSTFASTPPYKREVCRLLPSTTGDHKGFNDFILYLKQRECAGVIKIPTGKLWGRLLFLLPHSFDTCSLLGISPHPSDCLIALLLPKETNTEGV